MADDFDSLLIEHGLQNELRQAAAAVGTPTAGLALSVRGQQRIAYVTGAEGADAADASVPSMPMGCLMKLLTAALIAQAVEDGSFGWDSAIGDIAGVQLPPTGSLDHAITLRHLLSHSHGWDGPAIPRVPRRPDGRIDLRELFRAIDSVPPLVAVGRYYNYGNAGAWVCAALLEQVTGIAYRQLLLDRLLVPLRCAPERLADLGEPCPAADFNFALPLEGALRFLEAHLADSRSEPGGSCAAAFSPCTLLSWSLPLPGWSPSERRVCLGWKSYGSDWYGHNAQIPGYSAAMRINPKRKVACAFFGEGERAFSVFARLFSRRLPEFYEFTVPRMLDRSHASGLDLSSYQATFDSCFSSVVVNQTDDHRLEYRVHSHVPSAEPTLRADVPTVLAPAREHMFLPADPTRTRADFPFLQFLPAASGASFEYLWNGTNLWKRSHDSPAAHTTTGREPERQPELDLESWSRLMGRC